MAYTVLARRYRPQTFAEVIGQEPVARTLRNAIDADRVAHAYLFTGTRGVGKTTMARLLAKGLNCDRGPTADPCGACDSCTRTQEGDDIDVIEIDGASNTSVNDVRELRSSSIYAPARSRFKIYIIDEVHMLSTGAFNALLKTLEEPPEHVKFIFATTDPQKVPGTIHSRCQRFDFRAVATETIAAYLAELCKREKVKAETDALRVIAREGRGSVRDALTILDQAITLCGGKIELAPVLEALGLADSQRYFDLADAMAEGDVAKVLTLLEAALAEGAEESEFLDHLLDHLRALLLVRTVGRDAPGLEVTDEERGKLAEQAERYTADRLTLALEIAGEARYRIRGLAHARAMVELALVQMARLPDFASIRETLDRLGDLGGDAPAGAEGGEKKKSPAITVEEEQGAAPPTAAAGNEPPPPDDAEGDCPLPEVVDAEAEAYDSSDDDDAGEPQPSPGDDVCGTVTGDGDTVDQARPLTRQEQQQVRSDPKVRRILERLDGRVVFMGHLRRQDNEET